MTSFSRNARVAELLYLILMTAPLRLIYIPSKLFVSGNSSATANNIAAHDMLFRLGILNDLFTASMGIFLTLTFTDKPQRDFSWCSLACMVRGYLQTRYFGDAGCFPSGC